MQGERGKRGAPNRQRIFGCASPRNLVEQGARPTGKGVADQSEKAIHYRHLEACTVDSNRHLYEVELQRVKEASLASAMRDSTVMVGLIAPGHHCCPYRPSPADEFRDWLVQRRAFLESASCWLRERVNRRISVPGDAQVYLDLPELGCYPVGRIRCPPTDFQRLSPPAPCSGSPCLEIKWSGNGHMETQAVVGGGMRADHAHLYPVA